MSGRDPLAGRRGGYTRAERAVRKAIRIGGERMLADLNATFPPARTSEEVMRLLDEAEKIKRRLKFGMLALQDLPQALAEGHALLAAWQKLLQLPLFPLPEPGSGSSPSSDLHQAGEAKD